MDYRQFIGIAISILLFLLNYVVKVIPTWLALPGIGLCILIVILLAVRKRFYIARPLLRIKPIANTVGLKWPDKQIIPERMSVGKEDDKPPFAVLLTNIGNARAIDVKMVFRSRLEVKEIRAELQSTGVFPGFEIEDDKVTVFHEVGKNSWSAITLQLGNEDKRKISAVDFEPGHNEKLIEFPLRTKNSLILWLLSQSYRLGQIKSAKFGQEMAIMNELFEEKDSKKWAEYNKRRVKEDVLFCPDITVIISYKDISGHDFSETHVIRSIYQGSSPNWVIEGEQRYFSAFWGTLSFEDKENPSEGFFNMFTGPGGQRA